MVGKLALEHAHLPATRITATKGTAARASPTQFARNDLHSDHCVALPTVFGKRQVDPWRKAIALDRTSGGGNGGYGTFTAVCPVGWYIAGYGNYRDSDWTRTGEAQIYCCSAS